LLRADELNI